MNKDGRRKTRRKVFQSRRISRLNPRHPPFRGHLPAKEFRVPPPFISNKAASLIVAPDKTVFVGDRNHSRRPKSTENVFHLPARYTAKRPSLSGPLSRPAYTQTDFSSMESSVFALHQIQRIVIRIRTFNSFNIVGNNTAINAGYL